MSRFFLQSQSSPTAADVEPKTLSSQVSGAKTLRYFPFVDGLRAVSIIAVVAFHIGLPGFTGGFVGVDIFFLISGFLIINQIKSGLTAGNYSIWMLRSFFSFVFSSSSALSRFTSETSIPPNLALQL